MGLRQSLGQGQAQTVAFRTSGPIGTVEALKDVRQVGFVNALSEILNGNCGGRLAQFQGDDDSPTLR